MDRSLAIVGALAAAGTVVGAGAGVTATTSGPATAPAAAESSLPPVGATELQDSRGRITMTVPADWTDTNLGFSTADDGRSRPRILASPDYSASLDGWTIPRARLDAYPPSVEPATLLDAVSFHRRCTNGGVEPFDDGRYVGLRQTWTECGGGTYQLSHVAARSVDDSYTAFVRIGTPAPDDPAVELILASFGAVPGAVAMPPSTSPGSLDVIGPVDASLQQATVHVYAVPITDDTERLTFLAPGHWTDIATSPDTNDDQSERPTIQASTDFAAFAD